MNGPIENPNGGIGHWVCKHQTEAQLRHWSMGMLTEAWMGWLEYQQCFAVILERFLSVCGSYKNSTSWMFHLRCNYNYQRDKEVLLSFVIYCLKITWKKTNEMEEIPSFLRRRIQQALYYVNEYLCGKVMFSQVCVILSTGVDISGPMSFPGGGYVQGRMGIGGRGWVLTPRHGTRGWVPHYWGGQPPHVQSACRRYSSYWNGFMFFTANHWIEANLYYLFYI